MRFIQNLSPETCSLLHRIYKESQHHRVRQRAHCILLSSQSINTIALTAIFSVDRITIYNWFDAWESHHFAGLYDKKRCGCPPKLTDDEQNKAQYYLEQYPRDIRKVVPLLEQDTSKRVSTKTIKRLVKKNRYVWKRITKAPEKSPDPQQYERSTALIQRLQDQESRGISELWYFDVSGFCLTPYIPYAWQPMGSVIEIPTSTHRHRLNVLGFMNLHNGLYPYISLPDTFTSHFEMNT